MKGTWEEVIQRNEQAIHDLELQVVQSKHRELNRVQDGETFTLGKGTAASTERWYLETPTEDYYGDNIAEVLYQAADVGYPVLDWVTEFNEREERKDE